MKPKIFLYSGSAPSASIFTGFLFLKHCQLNDYVQYQSWAKKNYDFFLIFLYAQRNLLLDLKEKINWKHQERLATKSLLRTFYKLW